MKASLRTIFTAALVVLAAVYCTPSSDIDALNGRVDGLESRVSALEEKVKELNEVTVPGLKNLVNAIQNDNVFVTAVVEKENGYEIKFSDGTSAIIQNGKDGKDGEDGIDGKDGKDGKDGVDGKDGKDGKDGEDGTDGKDGTDGDTPVIGITIVDGVYVWTVNGTVITDDDGNPLPVTGNNGKDGKDGTDGTNGTDGVTPQFGIMDGHWIVSYDGGETWKTLGLTSNTDYSAYLAPDEETEDYIVLYVGSTRVEIPKEKTFTLKITIPENNGVKKGETASFAYTISGVSAADEVDVDIIGVSAGWEAEVVASDNASGVVKVTNNDDGDAKVTVYAANHKGKTDIRTLKFEGGKLEAVIETKDITSEGGELPLEITTNLDYTIVIPEAAQSWISCVKVKAVHTDNYTLTIAANETGAYRSATVQVVDAEGNSVKDIEVFQYPNPEVTTSIASVVALADNTKADLYNVTVVAASKVSTIVTDGKDYTYVADTSLVAGTVVNITGGTKKTDGLGLAYLSGAKAAAVTGATPVVIDEKAAFRYFRYTSFTYFSTFTNGTIAKVGEDYIFSTIYSGFKFVLEAPVDELNIDSYLGKLVAFKGWGKSIIAGSTVATYTFSVIPTEIKEVVPAVEPSWTVSYAGNSGDEDYPEAVKNTVAAPLTGETYALLTISENEIPAGSSILEAAISAAQDYTDNIQYQATYYRSRYTFNDILEGYTYTDTATENFEEFDYGKTYLIAVGVDTLGRVNGKYAAVEYNKVDPALKLAYEDYLGAWIVNGAEWEISAKETGVSYYIDGIPGSTYLATRGGNTRVTADYDATLGRLSVTEQVMASYEDPSGNGYGPLKDYFSGIFASGTSTYRNYPVNGEPATIFSFVKYSDDSYEIRRGYCENGKFTAFQFQWIIQTGANANRGNVYGSPVSLPITDISKSNKVKAKYEDFIGQFKIGTSLVTISEKVNGESYNVTGFPITGTIKGGQQPVFRFDATNGTLVFDEQNLGTFDDETYGKCQEMVSGTFTYGTTQYILYPINGTTQTTIFTVTANADGTFNIVPGTCNYGAIDGYKLAFVTEASSTRSYATTPLPTVFEKFVPDTDDSAVKKAAYNDFIGAWTVGAATWTISAKDVNSTYNIKGLPGFEYYDQVVANYDATNGNFYIMEQDLSPWTDNNGTAEDTSDDLDYQDVVSGVFASGAKEYAYYPFNSDGAKAKIVTVNMKESGNFAFVPGSCPYGDFVGICYSYFVTTEGESQGAGSREDTQYFAGIIGKPAGGTSAAAVRNIAPRAKMADKGAPCVKAPKLSYKAQQNVYSKADNNVAY